jgi:hypothetical protein
MPGGVQVTATMTVQQGRAHRGYRHEALLYRGRQGFLDAVVPFIRDGIDRGQPVLVAVVRPRIDALRAALGTDADQVYFMDMAELGANPARIIPAWREFVESHCAVDPADPNIRLGGAVRGVGEPVWAGRRHSELEECQFHESLLNLAISPDTPLWLLCPYDADALDAEVIDEVHRSHPAIIEPGSYRGSTTYGGAYHVGSLFGLELPPPTGPVRNLVVNGDDGHQVADWVRRWAEASGLSGQRSGRLATAMRTITQVSVSRPGQSEVLRLWQECSALICQIHDPGHVQDPMIGRHPDGQDTPRGRALQIANELCDLVQVRSGPAGTTIRVHTWL